MVKRKCVGGMAVRLQQLAKARHATQTLWTLSHQQWGTGRCSRQGSDKIKTLL